MGRSIMLALAVTLPDAPGFTKVWLIVELEPYQLGDPILVLYFNPLAKAYDVLSIHIVDALRSATR